MFVIGLFFKANITGIYVDRGSRYGNREEVGWKSVI